MDQTLKNRLVGAVVLLAVAATVLPLLFDGANERALMADTRMPAAPEVPDAGKLLATDQSTLAATQAAVEQAHAPAAVENAVVESASTASAPLAAAAAPALAVKPAVTAVPATPVAGSAVAIPATAATTPAPADPRLAKIAEAWDVQVAAGASAEGAERLRAKLAGAGYKARVRVEGGLYKTVVGPVLRREDAVALRDALGADGRVGKPRGMLVRYVP